MKSKKGAIELSINMLVVIILSLIILAGGIALLYKFLGNAQELKATLDARTEEEIQNLLLQEGKQVALPQNKAMIKRGEQKTFGLGVLNSGAPETFMVFVNPSSPNYISLDGIEEENLAVSSWVLYDNSPIQLDEQGSYSVAILVVVPADAVSGTYLFDVVVQRSNGQRYGPIQKIQVDVK